MLTASTFSRSPIWERYGTVLLWLTVPMYVVFSLIVFFTWVNPSMVGETQHHIAADSTTYLYFADSLREGRNEPWVLTSLASFPNTLWAPVLLALAVKSTFAILLVDYAMFFLAVRLLYKAVNLNLGLLLLLLLANVTTSISLISLNKEMIDLLVTALFIYYLARKQRWALAAALLIGLVNRYETAVVMMLYLLLQSRSNPLRFHRKTMLIVVAVLFSIFISTFLGSSMTARLQEAVDTATNGGLLLTLDNLQMHYLFFLALVPKVLDNLFSELVNIPHWPSYSLDDPANSYFLLGNNLSNVLVLLVLLVRDRLRLRSDLILYASLSAMLMSTAFIIQPRYFYGAYVVLCVECARRLPVRTAGLAGRVHAAA